MSRSERQVLEDAVRVTAEQAADSGRIVDEALAAGLAVDDPIVVHVKMLRLELLEVNRSGTRARAARAGLLRVRSDSPPRGGSGDLTGPLGASGTRAASRACYLTGHPRTFTFPSLAGRFHWVDAPREVESRGD